jgi:hypothetical protein
MVKHTTSQLNFIYIIGVHPSGSRPTGLVVGIEWVKPTTSQLDFTNIIGGCGL